MSIGSHSCHGHTVDKFLIFLGFTFCVKLGYKSLTRWTHLVQDPVYYSISPDWLINVAVITWQHAIHGWGRNSHVSSWALALSLFYPCSCSLIFQMPWGVLSSRTSIHLFFFYKKIPSTLPQLTFSVLFQGVARWQCFHWSTLTVAKQFHLRLTHSPFLILNANKTRLCYFLCGVQHLPCPPSYWWLSDSSLITDAVSTTNLLRPAGKIR